MPLARLVKLLGAPDLITSHRDGLEEVIEARWYGTPNAFCEVRRTYDPAAPSPAELVALILSDRY